MLKKVLLLVLTLTLLLSALAGCGGEKTPPGEDTTPPADGNTYGTDTDKEPGVARTWDDLPTTKYNTEFLMLGRSASVWSTYDLYSDDMKDTLGAAVFTRNLSVEARHGISIGATLLDDAKLQVTIDTMFLADLNTYDLYNFPIERWGKALLKGYFKDLNTLDVLDFEESWWDANFVDSISLYNQVYGIIGDATYVDKIATWAVMFNIDMLDAYEIKDNPYQLVDDHQWTMAKMEELAKAVNLDKNSDGKMVLADGDVYGICGETYNMDMLFQASGMPFAAFQDNKVVLNVLEHPEEAHNIFLRVYDLVSESTLVYNAEKHSEAYAGGRAFFEQQQALFSIAGLNNVIQYFRNYKHDYGILPMPKYTAEQSSYYHSVTVSGCPVFSIPRNARDPEMTATVLQALSCRGELAVMPVLYDTVLKGQASRDSESSRMLDLIFDTRLYDIGEIYVFGNLIGNGLNSAVGKLVYYEKKDEFVSTVQSNAEMAKDAVEELMVFLELNYAGNQQ